MDVQIPNNLLRKNITEFEEQHSQWLYTTEIGKILTYTLSLEWPFFISTFIIESIIYLVFCLIFVFVEDEVPSVVIGIFFYAYCWFIWGYQIYTLIKVAYRHLKLSVLSIGITLYLITIQQNGVIFSVVRILDTSAFVGIEPGFSRSSILGLSHFLGIETIAGLGTGAIFANNTTQTGFWFVAICSAQGSCSFTISSSYFNHNVG